MIRKPLTLAYATGGYLVGLASIALIVTFLADLPLPWAIDAGTPGPLWPSVAAFRQPCPSRRVEGGAQPQSRPYPAGDDVRRDVQQRQLLGHDGGFGPGRRIEQAQQGGLPDAATPHEGHLLTRLDSEGDVLERGAALVMGAGLRPFEVRTQSIKPMSFAVSSMARTSPGR